MNTQDSPSPTRLQRAAHPVLTVLWLALLMAPLALFGHPGTLTGVTVPTAQPTWTWTGWQSQVFQRTAEAYFQEQFGLRADWARSGQRATCWPG